MIVRDILKLLRDDKHKISIRIENWFKFIAIKSSFPEEYLERKVIDIIPNIDYDSIENGCFVINIEGE